MSTNKTVYIIGAGASKEAKLPTGLELKEKISKTLYSSTDTGRGYPEFRDQTIEKAIRIHVQKTEDNASNFNHVFNQYLNASQQICTAMPQAISIDNFIDNHRGNEKIELCGKLAIAKTILESEKKSLLYIDPSNIYNKMTFSPLETTWYGSFLKILTENCTVHELSDRLKSIALIIFNYDRCFEHFLYNALQNFYGITPEKAAEFVNSIEIYHPYGTVGSLSWQERNRSIEYGMDPNSENLLSIQNFIKTFTEGTDPNSSDIISIQKNILEATRIVFLGFAFHKLNLKLLVPEIPKNKIVKTIPFFYTASGLSDTDSETVQDDIKELLKPSVLIQFSKVKN